MDKIPQNPQDHPFGIKKSQEGRSSHPIPSAEEALKRVGSESTDPNTKARKTKARKTTISDLSYNVVGETMDFLRVGEKAVFSEAVSRSKEPSRLIRSELKKSIRNDFEKYLDPVYSPKTEFDLLEMLSVVKVVKEMDPEKSFALLRKTIIEAERILLPQRLVEIQNRPPSDEKEDLIMLGKFIPFVNALRRFSGISSSIAAMSIIPNIVPFMLWCIRDAKKKYPSLNESVGEMILVSKLPKSPEKNNLLRQIFEKLELSRSLTPNVDCEQPDCPDEETKILCNLIIRQLEIDSRPENRKLHIAMIKSLGDDYPRKEKLLQEITKIVYEYETAEKIAIEEDAMFGDNYYDDEMQIISPKYQNSCKRCLTDLITKP